MPPFDGVTYDRERDGVRLNSQLESVLDLMATGAWFTVAELKKTVKGTDASITARIRDLRKEQFGGYSIEREYVERGVWKYRLVA